VSGQAQFGPEVSDQGVTFRLWAPAARQVSLVLDAPVDMPKHDGWFELHVPQAKAGARYRFKIDGDLEIPDPASQFQPQDVHGASEVVDHRYAWKAADWRGLPWEQAVFLEAHVGTFTSQGTYRAMMERLDHLADTGITALELMPLADFPGRWNWGYDGVLSYAPDSTYGGPQDLKALIDAAHMRGLMVFLDVVYNHFGPEGNYLGHIAPAFFSDAETPWGGAIDYRVPEVRAFVIENALHWLRDYRFDGLRLDAVHAIVTPGELHVLTELSAAVGRFAAETGRHIHLVLENDDNSASLLAPDVDPPAGKYRAQWNDDYHHAWHVLLTGEDAGYYRDYADAEVHVARTLAQGFAYQGEPSAHRKGEPRGEPSNDLARSAFVNFIQNHDQIGNRPMGERLSVLAKPEALQAALAVLLLQPSPPMLFMGEEWGATEPFPFFCDFGKPLADAVRNGRKKEFAEAYAKHGDQIPDPLSANTRASAVLDWNALTKPAHAARLALTRSLLGVRKKWIEPLLPAMIGEGKAGLKDGLLFAQWPAGDKTLVLTANLSDALRPRPEPFKGESIWGDSPPDQLPPWSVYAAINISPSFRGASETSEPGIQGQTPSINLDSGSGASHRPGMTRNKNTAIGR
jgi:malto-oligosyltrehalose trehalohydrolase